jgi:hypothetical protein
MSHEAYCEDFFTTADKNTIAFVEQIMIWKKRNLTLYPTDVLNLMIDHNLISMVEVEQIIESTKNKSLDITLPTRYIED